MTTYSQMFPPNSDGTANRHASLPLAEQGLPGEILESAGLDTGEPFRDALNTAWAFVDYALATPERTGDAQYFDAAEGYLTAITSDPGASLVDPVVLNARLLRTNLEGFRARAAGQPITPGIIDRAQARVGEVLVDFMRTRHTSYRQYVGRLSEIMTIYALLCGRNFPFMASPREESNRFAPDNHDVYVLDGEQKVPFSVKHIGPEGDNRLVLTLRMGFVALNAMRATGLIQSDGSQNLVQDTPTHELALIMFRHTLGQRLTDEEVTFLRFAIVDVERKMNRFRATGYSAVDEELPAIPRTRPQTG